MKVGTMNREESALLRRTGEVFSLPAFYYVDERHYARELERFFFKRWIHAGRVEELPEVGRYVVRSIADESIIITRSSDGQLRAFHNVCRHRGTRLCEAVEGRFPGVIRCPYHAWTFDLTGRLVAAPQMDGLAHFRKEDYPLGEVAVGHWDGHIFLNLAQNPAPLRDQLADLPEKFAAWGMQDLRLVRRIRYDVAANWKLIIHNYSECLHCPGVHPDLQRLSHYLSGENEPANQFYLGGRMILREGVETLSVDGRSVCGGLPGVSPQDRHRVYYYAVLPNLLLSLHPDYMMTHTLWPRGVGRTEIVCEWHVHPLALGRSDFDPEPFIAFWDLTNRQDWHVCEQMQLGLRSRAYRPGPYSPREELLHGFDAIIVGDGEVEVPSSVGSSSNEKPGADPPL